MRCFIRHPTDIPLEVSISGVEELGSSRLRNISEGGLCFRSDTNLALGTRVHVLIPVQDPPFEADGVVVWSHFQRGYYQVGVEFDEQTTKFALRMVEQVCHIEQYRKEVLETEGRYLSQEKATVEWIARYASKFPIRH